MSHWTARCRDSLRVPDDGAPAGTSLHRLPDHVRSSWPRRDRVASGSDVSIGGRRRVCRVRTSPGGNSTQRRTVHPPASSVTPARRAADRGAELRLRVLHLKALAPAGRGLAPRTGRIRRRRSVRRCSTAPGRVRRSNRACACLAAGGRPCSSPGRRLLEMILQSAVAAADADRPRCSARRAAVGQALERDRRRRGN